MGKEHRYHLNLKWTGNTGEGTAGYRSYERSHVFSVDGKPEVQASSDPAFRGDRSKYNPEELLVASLSGCHMLWYLHLCSDAGIIIVKYSDNATGVMEETPDGGGRFREVILKPAVVITDKTRIGDAEALHIRANEMCFIANSVNFPVRHEPKVSVTPV